MHLSGFREMFRQSAEPHLIRTRLEHVSRREGRPPGTAHDELALLVDAALHRRALRAATLNPLSSWPVRLPGTIEAGKIANLVLLDADPLQDIPHAKNHGCDSEGAIDRQMLDRMVSRAAVNARRRLHIKGPAAL